MATPLAGVVFDFFGTLTPGLEIGVVEGSMARVGHLLGVDTVGFSAEMRRSWPERSIGALGDSRSTLAEIAARVGGAPTDDMLSAALAIRMADFLEMTALRPGVESMLEELRRRGVRTCIVSDCSPELAELWPSLPISTLVDEVVLSSVIGAKKPDPEVFLMAARLIGLDPGACLYVGDGGSDELAGARSVGMTPIAIVEPGTDGFYVHDRGIPHDVDVITSLDEILALG
jgi:putative hydrolase of the HAD superfamily